MLGTAQPSLTSPHNSTRPFNSWDGVKLIALLLVFIDHAGNYLYPDQLWLRAIGRGAAPVFLFLAGYASSYRFRWDILLLAMLLAYSNILLGQPFHVLNILFLIVACRGIFDCLERHGKHIARPHEWFICAVVFLPVSIYIVQYGSIGLMFAICGYMKRHSQYYTKRQLQLYLMIAFVSLGATQSLLFGFSYMENAIMIAVSLLMYLLLLRLEIKPIALRLPLARAGKAMASYSGYIYAIHLLILSWLTGLPI